MMLGRRVQQYQFTEKLGAGGMGEIYKALDTRLSRTVAIKVLPSARSGDPDRRRRFLQEAQAASGLNHPSIITIHDVISEGDTEFMVMEYVHGKTLNDLIPKGGLRVPLVIKYALQMADALSTAHAAGIVHRDLKPANVMVTESGLVKILDFGLAKLTDQGPIPDDDSTRTIANSAPLTVEGSILGTVSYMSPEQAQGKKVDTRSDIFSFGAVLYEMATGRRAFEGESSLSTLSSILRDEPKPMIEVAPDVPAALESVFLRCLRKNPDDRWQSMKEVQQALSALKRESDSGSLYTTRMMTPAAAPVSQASKPPLPPASSIGTPANKSILGIGALVVLLIAGGSAWYVAKKQAAQKAAAAAAASAQATPPPAPVEAAPPPPPPPDTTVTNDTVAEMVKEKVPGDLILSQIRAADKTNFDLSTSEIIRLSKLGVTPLIIEQMRNPKHVPLPPPVPARASGAPAQTAKQNAPAPVPVPAPVAVSTPVVTPTPVPIATSPAATLPPPAPAPVAAGPKMVNVTVPDALPLRITLAADIPADSDLARPIRFTATEDFTVNGTVVIPKGASVYGEISETAKKKGVFGLGGTKLSFKLTKAEAAGGHTINVRALAARRGDGVTQRQVESGPKTKDVAAAQGAQYIAYIDGEQPITVPQK
jgi:serine/threonine-protein kinase